MIANKSDIVSEMRLHRFIEMNMAYILKHITKGVMCTRRATFKQVGAIFKFFQAFITKKTKIPVSCEITIETIQISNLTKQMCTQTPIYGNIIFFIVEALTVYLVFYCWSKDASISTLWRRYVICHRVLKDYLNTTHLSDCRHSVANRYVKLGYKRRWIKIVKLLWHGSNAGLTIDVHLYML